MRKKGKMMTKLYLVLTVVLSLLPCYKATNKRPIIGVLAQETNPHNDHRHGDTFIPAGYVKYLQLAGARVVPVRVKESMEYYTYMFKSLNGLLFPGGGVSITSSEYHKAAQIFYDMVTQSNEANEYFPLWGTCNGFELLTAITSGKNLMSSFDAHDLALPLTLSKDFRSSRLFGNLPKDVYTYLTTKNVTENFHSYGLMPSTYATNAKLNTFYRVLSTNVDRNGKPFVSTIEAFRYPIYATQWHPEKTIYNWNLKYHVNNGPEAVRVSQHMANFLVAEARKSSHTFPSLEKEIDALIDNYQPVFSRDSTFENIYFFNFTSRQTLS